jgi:hypothetical protein
MSRWTYGWNKDLFIQTFGDIDFFKNKNKNKKEVKQK